MSRPIYISFVVNSHLLSGCNIFPVIIAKTFLPVLVVVIFRIKRSKITQNMCGSRKFCQRGPNIFFDKGKEDPNSTKSGPSSARQRNAILMAFRWRTDDGVSLAGR